MVTLCGEILRDTGSEILISLVLGHGHAIRVGLKGQVWFRKIQIKELARRPDDRYDTIEVPEWVAKAMAQELRARLAAAEARQAAACPESVPAPRKGRKKKR